MKANIFEIKRFAVHDGRGIRTTVFLKGCPLSCLWCHNPEGISGKGQLAFYENRCVSCGKCVAACKQGAHFISNGSHRFDSKKCMSCGACSSVCLEGALKFYGSEMSEDELLPILLEDKDFYETTGGGVTLSGGECLLQSDFCASILKKLKEKGVDTAVDTSGYVPRKSIEKVIPYTDMFLYDIKAFDPEVHKRCTGRDNGLILENLKYIDECGKDVEIRFPLVPGYNDGEVERIAEFLKDLKCITAVRVLPYHFPGSKYEVLGEECEVAHMTVSNELLELSKNIFKKHGLNVV